MAVMIGTTHFINAVVQRRDLVRVPAIHIGLPASASLEPMVDWPRDLRVVVDPLIFMVEGGHETDGRPFMPLDKKAVRAAASKIRDSGIQAVGISSMFLPLTAKQEIRAAELVSAIRPQANEWVAPRATLATRYTVFRARLTRWCRLAVCAHCFACPTCCR